MEQQIRHYESKLAFEIDSWDVYEAQMAGRAVTVLDVRPTASFEKEHIAGAISFPHRQLVEENVVHLAKDVEYVTYCDGIGCNASTAGALKMARLGFRVKELIGGLAWWKEHGYPTGVAHPVAAAESEACGCE